MQHAEGISAVGPDQQQGIFALWNAAQILLHIGHGADLVAVDADDHVPRAKAGIVRRTAGNDALDHGALEVLAAAQFLPHVGSQFPEAETPAGLAVSGAGARVFTLV